jgi:hypothetical protein
MSEDKIDWRKYLIAFLITVALFLSAGYLSNYLGGKKLGQLKDIQNKIAIDVLSSETQYALLSDLSCRNVSGALLSGELTELGRKLEWGEENLGASAEVLYLKKYYSLLQIKDYLLMKQISERCKVKSAFVLYFYTTAEHCRECERTGLVLTALRNKYSELRVYSFDYGIDLSAVKSMLDIFQIDDTKLPALVIGEEVLSGFRPIEELEERILDSFKLKETEPEKSEEKSG